MLRVGLVLLLLLSCATGRGVALTADELARSGSADFAAPAERVFAAMAGALRAAGYPTAVESPEAGILRTGRKVVRSVHQPGVGDVPVSRQYAVKVTSDGQRVRVVATPSVFIGEQDVSQDPVWQLDGADGERALWSSLFHEAQTLLDEGAAIPGRPGAL